MSMTINIDVKVINKVSVPKQSIFSNLNNLEDGWVKELVELWQYNVVENKSELFDPPGLVHVCQGSRGYDGSVKGNCYKYHLEIGETPCTPHETCKLRDGFREAQDVEARKINRSEKKNTTKKQCQSLLDQELQQQRKYQQRRQQADNWNPLEDLEI